MDDHLESRWFHIAVTDDAVADGVLPLDRTAGLHEHDLLLVARTREVLRVVDVDPVRVVHVVGDEVPWCAGDEVLLVGSAVPA